MIRSVRIRGFKRFREVEFRLPGHVVLAGPNDTGKTTLLQAIASWALALRRWRELNDFNRRNGYRKVPITRQAFVAVPLRSFDLLWTDRRYHGKIEIELRHDAGWAVTMEFIADSTEQIYVRPARDSIADLRETDLQAVFIPPMTGLATDEPPLLWPTIEQLLSFGRPGEVLRNLLAEVNRNQVAWEALQTTVLKLFGYQLLPPDATGAYIRAEYQMTEQGAPLDIASAGSGFQQVLMLLAFLNTRRNAVMLLDEPDAHLHMILQDAIYHELRSTAARHGSQLIVATHSEVVINTVEPRELVVTLSQPRLVADNQERSRLISSLRVLSNADVTQALVVRGILYVEDYTDINILRAWAETLQHRASGLLTTELESYLIHPDALARFVTAQVGAGVARQHVDDMLTWWRREWPPALADDPLGDHPFLNGTKARTDLLPPLLEAAEIFMLPYTRYHEIAALMLPEEIHPEVSEKLDAICRAFGVQP